MSTLLRARIVAEAIWCRLARILLVTSYGAGLFFVSSGVAVAAENRNDRVRRDHSEVMAGGKWIYNDLTRGFAEAQRLNKPLLVVLRCVP